MSSSASRRSVSLAVAVCLAMGLTAAAIPALAAPSPEAAVTELLDRAATGVLGDLDGLVCAEQQEALRARFDPATLLADPAASPDPGQFEGLAFRFSDPSVSVLSQDADGALVRLTATMSIEMDEAQVRDYVVGLMEAAEGEFSGEEVDQMVGLFASSLAAGQEIDEELALIREGGGWVVCDDFEDEAEAEPGLEASVSLEGMCGLLEPAELEGLGQLRYDSSIGGDDFCTYSSSALEDVHSLSLSLDRGDSVADLRPLFEGGVDTDVAGLPAYAYAPGGMLFVAVDGGVLQVALYLEEGSEAQGTDPIAHAVRVAELIIPRLPELAPDPDDMGDAEADPGSAQGPPLCELLTLEDLNTLGPLDYQEVTGEGGSCFFTSISEDQGFHSLSLYTETLELEVLRQIFPDGTELTAGGQPAYSDGTSLWIGLDDRLLTIVPYSFGSPAAESLDPVAYAVQVADIIVPRLLEAGRDG